ncbi:hypothetical protein KY284_032543 [Solanum tuberosum]|nr:hypothetical protein KY284_032543 [Solanum tuberosum]
MIRCKGFEQCEGKRTRHSGDYGGAPPRSDVKRITSWPFTRIQAQDLQRIQGLFMKMEVLEMVLTTSKDFYALKMAEEVPFGMQGLLGALPNGLGDGPSPPNVTERG